MDLKAYLRRLLITGNHSHFYLFSEEGFVMEALYVLFCESHGKCLNCRGCFQVEHLNAPDLFILRSEDEGKIRDEQVEDAIAHTNTVSSGRYHVVAVFEAHKMTVRAQNRFLKSLEEAPENVIYLMETKYPEMLLSTVLSRAMRIRGGKGISDADTDDVTDLTMMFVEADTKALDSYIKQYKDKKSELIDRLCMTVSELNRLFRFKAKHRKYSEGGESFDSQLREMERYRSLILRIDAAIRNLEQNGNFDLNADMLVFGRNFV